MVIEIIKWIFGVKPKIEETGVKTIDFNFSERSAQKDHLERNWMIHQCKRKEIKLGVKQIEIMQDFPVLLGVETSDNQTRKTNEPKSKVERKKNTGYSAPISSNIGYNAAQGLLLHVAVF